MGLTDKLKKMFGKSDGKQKENTNHKEVKSNFIVTIYNEIMSEQYDDFYSSIKFSNSNGYKELKKTATSFQKEIAYELLNKIGNKPPISYLYGNNSESMKKRYFHTQLFNSLMRSNLGFSISEFKGLFDHYEKSSKEMHLYSNWPIGYTLNQLEKKIKKEGLEKDSKDLLKYLLTTKPFKTLGEENYPYQTSSHISKINKLIGDTNNLNNKEYDLFKFKEDRLGRLLNNCLEEFNIEDQKKLVNFFTFQLVQKVGNPQKHF